MTGMRMARSIATLGAVAALALLIGCGSDESGSETTAANVSIPSPTSPIPPASTEQQTTAPAQKTQKTKSTTGGTAPGACAIPDTYQDFKFTGTSCTAAVAVATAWDQSGKDCNTIDNPDSPLGYKRTCTVNGFSCTAKRDVHSDGRFVACTQGGTSIRFTWFPI